MRTRQWGTPSPLQTTLAALAILVTTGAAFADPVAFVPTQTVPDAPPRVAKPAPVLRPTWDLDGLYFYLGPVGAAGREAGTWDSELGGDLAVVRVREHRPLGAIGGMLGATKWTSHGGGEVWVDALIGTELLGHMVGLSAGPLLELDQLAKPRLGGTVGIWGYGGIAPFARVGFIEEDGLIVLIGLHIPLPVFRH